MMTSMFECKEVYVLALPRKGLESLVNKKLMIALIVLIVILVAMVVAIVAFVYLTVRVARREMYLCAALIKQMEATQQDERKSLNKSLAFASASHDVRASLAGISGLIDISRDEVSPGSELETNLLQMEKCTKELLGMLNSILDTSRIEAGKMQLEEEEFDLAQLLEDVVDLFHPAGMKKGVDVMLDICDGSISKFAKVKGDRTKLMLVLWNLLSNAVKFTSEGHVVVRAWAKKPSFGKSIFSSAKNTSWPCLSCFFLKNDGAYKDMETTDPIQENESSLEFVFEVDDTGKGIPKEKQNTVFENYVQVKETSCGLEGTGLGLGIVQSLVRLMGGNIGIVDKELGEKGTCFRFNIFLTTYKVEANSAGNARGDDIESPPGGYASIDSVHHSAPSTRPTSPKRKASHVVLFIQSEKRQRVSQKFMETLGIKVYAVKEWEQLPRTLKKLKEKLNLSHHSSSGRSEWSSMSRTGSRGSSTGAKDLPLSALDGIEHIPSLFHWRTNLKGVPNFILLVIDINAGPFRELSRGVAEFRRYLLPETCCRIIWIYKPGARNIHSKGLDEYNLPSTDLIISKPFHGSRLFQVIRLLPEFGGTLPDEVPEQRRQYTDQATNVPLGLHTSTSETHRMSKSNTEIPENSSEIHKYGQEQATTSSERP